MKAAVVTTFSEALTIEDRLVPEPGVGQVLVRLEACGLCHTDIHAANGDWPVTPTLPLVPGHEGVGIVEKLGEGVTSPRLDDRVAIAWVGFVCGECRYCTDGRETLCEQQLDSGYSIDGAFAEYTVVSARFATRVSDGITPIDAAPLSCAGVTIYKALKVASIVPTERVAIFGIGGLTHLAVQWARIMGGSVVDVDIEKEKLDRGNAARPRRGVCPPCGRTHEGHRRKPPTRPSERGDGGGTLEQSSRTTRVRVLRRSLRRRWFRGRSIPVSIPRFGSLSHGLRILPRGPRAVGKCVRPTATLQLVTDREGLHRQQALTRL